MIQTGVRKLEAGSEEKKGAPGGTAPKPLPLSGSWLHREVLSRLCLPPPDSDPAGSRPLAGGGACAKTDAHWVGWREQL